MLTPKPEQVVLNLMTLYLDPDFQTAISARKDQIQGYHDGIGRYGNTQAEVVLHVDTVGPDEICTMGGYSSNRAVLSRLLLGHEPNAAEQIWIDKNIAQSGIEPGGPWWLSTEGWLNVYARIKPKINELRSRGKSLSG
jgi:hypothetical protein